MKNAMVCEVAGYKLVATEWWYSEKAKEILVAEFHVEHGGDKEPLKDLLDYTGPLSDEESWSGLVKAFVECVANN